MGLNVVGCSGAVVGLNVVGLKWGLVVGLNVVWGLHWA